MTTSHIEVSSGARRAGHRFGYLVAIVVNLVMLGAVQFILEWGWIPFLTDELEGLIPLISLSLIVTVIANLVYLFDDTVFVKSTAEIGVNLMSLYVTYQIYLVFPFDFSAYTFDWEMPARILLILAMVGTGIGVLASAWQLHRASLREGR